MKISLSSRMFVKYNVIYIYTSNLDLEIIPGHHLTLCISMLETTCTTNDENIQGEIP